MGYASGIAFTETKLSLLCDLVKGYHAASKLPAWSKISAELGHTSESCKATWYALRQKHPEIDYRLQMPGIRDQIIARMAEAARTKIDVAARRKKEARARLRADEIVQRQMEERRIAQLVPALANPRNNTLDPGTRRTRYGIDPEMRARIELLGPNALLGDPIPGRSALDKKRASVAP